MAVACLIVLVVFNIVFVKMFIGSKVLSDGRHIKHPGQQGPTLCDRDEVHARVPRAAECLSSAAIVL